MKQMINRLFIAHPSTVNESYFEHFAFAGWFGMKLLGAGFAALIHAFIPMLFEKTAGNIIRELAARIEHR